MDSIEENFGDDGRRALEQDRGRLRVEVTRPSVIPRS
jgi:hypothetical protein